MSSRYKLKSMSVSVYRYEKSSKCFGIVRIISRQRTTPGKTPSKAIDREKETRNIRF
jgi:hypothetical protein